MTFIDWFAGIGGFGLAFRRAGHLCVGACEIDTHARRVYAARLGDPRWFPADLRQVTATEIPEADLWTGGFPCSDVSVAGPRTGINGARTGLIFDLLRLAAIRRPPWLLLENVPGLLSGARDDAETDDDAAASAGSPVRPADRPVDGPAGRSVSWFGALLGAMADAGYGRIAWRVLDSRWFGVAQRRRRVFIVAHAGDGADPGQVIFEPEGRAGDSPSGDTAGSDLAGTLGAGASGSGWRDDLDRSGAFIPVAFQERWRADGRRVECQTDLAYAMMANDAGGSRGKVAFVKTHRAPRDGSGDIWRHQDTAPTLNVNDLVGGQGRAVALIVGQQQGSDVGTSVEHTGTLRAGNGDVQSGVPFIAVQAAEAARLIATALQGSDGRRNWRGDGTDNLVIAHPLTASAGHHGHSSPRGDGADNLVVEQHASTRGGDPVAHALNAHASRLYDGESETLVSTALAVRRLTPTEAERLQGFPDGWSCLCGCDPYSTAACCCPDGPRYRALGNAVTVPVIEWIARRLGVNGLA